MKALSDRFWSKVEKSEGCWNWIGAISAYGYGRFGVDGKNRLAHRVGYELQVAPIPAGMVIDHICHNRKCVNPEHLRVATVKQNNENHTGPRRDSKSGVRGVHWDSAWGAWIAQVTHNRQKVYVGRFNTINEANEAVIAARLSLQTHNDADRMRAV